MKTFKTIALLMLVANAAWAQKLPNFTTSSFLEFTLEGPKVGWSVGKPYSVRYKYSNEEILIDTGLFYQLDVPGFTKASRPPAATDETGISDFKKLKNREIVLGGAYVGFEARRDKLRTGINFRAGLKNGQDFVIIPAMTIARSFGKHFAIGTGMAVRIPANPSFMLTVSFK